MAKVENNLKDTEDLPKYSSGIRGLDEILDGRLPRVCPMLVAGGAGSGKTSVRDK